MLKRRRGIKERLKAVGERQKAEVRRQKWKDHRAIIDTVQPPAILAAPSLLNGPSRNGTNFEFTFSTQINRTYRVEVSTNLVNWTTLRAVTNVAGSQVLRDTNAPLNQRFYRTVTP